MVATSYIVVYISYHIIFQPSWMLYFCIYRADVKNGSELGKHNDMKVMEVSMWKEYL